MVLTSSKNYLMLSLASSGICFISSFILFCTNLTNSVSLSILPFASLSKISNSFALLSAFYVTLFLIFLALFPNLSVDRVSLSLYALREHVITRHVWEFPPKDSYNILVSFESLYGMCPPALPSVSALITLPKADRDLLIILASSRV
jgi:tellurite resistance protein TehA-like permease